VEIEAKPGQQDVGGTEGADVILAGAGAQLINGKGGADTICSGLGDDFIIGGPGDDVMRGGAGDDDFIAGPTDDINGGAGGDSAQYSRDAKAGVEVNLARGRVRSAVELGDEGATGRIESVARVFGTDFADELRGDGADNRLYGGQGRDFLDGRGGDDDLHGGNGIDEVSYESAPARVRISKGRQGRDLEAKVGGDTDDIGLVEIITGSDHDDKLDGTGDSDSIYGGKGDDIIKGFDGNDKLFGGRGNDRFAPGAGDDRVEGGENRAVESKAEPGDLVNFKNGELEGGYDQMEIHLDLTLPPPVSPFQPRPRYHAIGEGNDIITGVESVRGMDGAFNFIYADDGPNVIVGGNRGDYVEAFGGNDWVYTDGYPDTLYGGDGNDYLDPGGNHEITDGGEGNDTCVQDAPDYTESCEKEGRG
jgi:Ca2+-binding RTX toxin-like protein